MTSPGDRQFTLQWVLLQTAVVGCMLGALRFVLMETANSLGRTVGIFIAICCFFGILIGSIERTCRSTIITMLLTALDIVCSMSLGLLLIVLNGGIEEVVRLFQ